MDNISVNDDINNESVEGKEDEHGNGNLFSSSEIMDMDWSLLIQQSKPSFPPDSKGTNRSRVSAAATLVRTGFSHDHLPYHFAEELNEFCKNELKDQYEPLSQSIPALNCLARDQNHARKTLLTSEKFMYGALSARKDLEIRRILASIPLDSTSHLASLTSSS